MRRLVIAFAAGLVVPAAANAQRLAASYGLSYSEHKLIRILNGYDLRATTPRFRALSATLSFGRHAGTHGRRGVACGGFPDPNEFCPVEPLRDEATSTNFGGALDVTLHPNERIAGTVSFGLQVIRLKSSTRGETTGNRIQTKPMKIGPAIGFELNTQPRTTVPVGVRFGVASGLFVAPGTDWTDTYAPFESPFSITRFDVGLVWFIRR